MQIKYSSKARKQLSRIVKSDKRNAKRIVERIEQYAENPSGSYDIKALKGKRASFLRLRVGDYRIIFEIEKVTMLIYEINHRQESY